LLLRMVAEEPYQELRTNRNKLLISKNEQQKLWSSTVGIAGLSVGAGIALGLVYSGISKTIKIADLDTISTSNLNRLQASVKDVSKSKVDLAAQRIYEISPYSNVRTFPGGINGKNIDQFFVGDYPLNVVFDEIDDFKIKVKLRLKAKEIKIPLIMLTSLGDGVLIDIERYDIDVKTKPFLGFADKAVESIKNNKEITPDDIKRYSVQLVEPKYVPTRALESLIAMNKTLVGRPQLYSTVAINGGLAAYLSRQILLGKELKSGRYFLNLEDAFDFQSFELANTPKRQDLLNKLIGQQ
jgi:hypothetical protein